MRSKFEFFLKPLAETYIYIREFCVQAKLDSKAKLRPKRCIL